MGYQIVRIISMIVREFYLLNPFEKVLSSLNLGFDVTGLSALLLVVVSPIIHKWTYFVVGLFYEDRLNPWKGSIWYLFFSFIHMIVLEQILLNYNIFSIIIITCFYLILLFVIKACLSYLCRKLRWN